MSDAVDIGALAGRVQFEDQATATMDLILKKIDGLEEGMDGLGKRGSDVAKGFLTAEVGMETFKKAAEVALDVVKGLTVEGAGLADIRENFEHMTTSVGRLSSTLMNELRVGTHNTIDDMELMKSVNQDLAAGMNLTDKQFRTLADGSFALAQATGKDVKESFDIVNDAMLTGRTRALQLLTGKIDLDKAEREYAERLGTTADRLTQEGKLEAARVAILDSVTSATKRLGDQQDGLDELVAQSSAAWQNFYDDLKMSVATSPEVARAFNTVKGALVETFGGDKQDMIKTITGWVNNLADTITTVGPPVVAVLGKIGEGVAFIARGLSSDISSGQDMVHKLSLMVQGYSGAEADAEVATYHATMAMREQAKIAAEHSKELAHDAEVASAAATEQARIGSIEEHNRLVIQQTTEELKKRHEAQAEIASSAKDFHDTVKALDQDLVATIKTYLEAGVAQDKLAAAYGLTATQVNAVAKVLKEEQEAHKLEEKAVNDSAARWEEYYATRTEMSGTETDKTVADIERWKAAEIKSHKDAKTDTTDFYTWLGATEKQAYEKSEQARLEADTHSKAYWDKQSRQAQDAFDFAQQHSDQFTAEYIAGLERTKLAAADAAKNWKEHIGSELDHETEQAKQLAAAMRAMGGSQEVTSQNFEQSINNLITSGGWNRSGMGSNITLDEATRLAKLGYSMQEIKSIFDNRKNGASGPLPPPHGPRIPGFSEGGVGDFGDGTLAMLHGKEAIVPLDKGGAGGVVVHQYINGTAADVARQVSVELMRTLKQFKQFGSAT